MTNGLVNKVVVGADRIVRTGHVFNNTYKSDSVKRLYRLFIDFLLYFERFWKPWAAFGSTLRPFGAISTDFLGSVLSSMFLLQTNVQIHPAGSSK